MAQKNATPSRQQQEVLKRNGLMPMFWAVVDDNRNYLIVTNRFTGKVKVINK